jgi:hypothetical protein
MAMTPYQQGKLEQLQNELLSPRGIATRLRVVGEDSGYVFTEVEGVTVVLIKRASPKPFGGYILPAVMTYKETGQRPQTSLDAAVWADELFEKQSAARSQTEGALGSDCHCKLALRDRRLPVSTTRHTCPSKKKWSRPSMRSDG